MNINLDSSDRLIQGAGSGFAAGIVSETLSFILGALGITQIRYVDYAGLLLLGNIPDNIIEVVLSTFLATFFAMFLGIAFAYLILLIGSENLYFKSWFYGVATWYFWYSLLVMTFTEQIQEISALTSISNFVVASLYGIVLGVVYNKIYISAS